MTQPFHTLIVSMIDHKEQRYNTAGDYLEVGKSWILNISKTEDWRCSAAVLIHEIVEMFLTKHNGVKWEDIDAFDTGIGKDLADPGLCPAAPYHKEHMIAEEFEREFVVQIGLTWEEYQDALDSLEYGDGP